MMEYDGAYSILTKKTYQRDATNTVIEEYALTADKKLVESEKISEKVGTVTTVKQLTKYVYDANYNLTQEQSYYGSLSAPATYYATAFTYDPATKLPLPLTRTVTGVKDADGADAAGTITAGTVIEKFEYDSFGKTLKHTDANNKVTQFSYDLVGRITKTTYPDAKTKSIVYTDASNYMTVTDENGKVRQFYYTPLGQINKVYDGAGTTLLAMYEYDAMG